MTKADRISFFIGTFVGIFLGGAVGSICTALSAGALQ